MSRLAERLLGGGGVSTPTPNRHIGTQPPIGAWGQLLSRLEVSEDAASDIEAELSRLGDWIVESSPLLDQLRQELSGVREALGSSVADVSLATLPPRLEELARGIDVLVTTPGAASIPLRMQGMGSRSLAALMAFRAFATARLASIIRAASQGR